MCKYLAQMPLRGFYWVVVSFADVSSIQSRFSPFRLQRTATASPDAANAPILLTIAVTTPRNLFCHQNYTASIALFKKILACLDQVRLTKKSHMVLRSRLSTSFCRFPCKQAVLTESQFTCLIALICQFQCLFHVAIVSLQVLNNDKQDDGYSGRKARINLKSAIHVDSCELHCYSGNGALWHDVS